MQLHIVIVIAYFSALQSLQGIAILASWDPQPCFWTRDPWIVCAQLPGIFGIEKLLLHYNLQQFHFHSFAINNNVLSAVPLQRSTI